MITDMCPSVCVRVRACVSRRACVSLSDISVAFWQQLKMGNDRCLLKVPYRVFGYMHAASNGDK